MTCPLVLTEDGYETQFGTNYTGHMVLIKLLFPLLQETARSFPDTDVSIIKLSSSANTWAPGGGLVLQDVSTNVESFTTRERYGQSTLANILHAEEFTKRYPEIKVVSLHPGAVNTSLGRGLPEGYPYLRYPMATVAPLISVSTDIGALNQ